MMRISRKAEPPDFHTKVRAKGQTFLNANPHVPPVPLTFWRGKGYWTLAKSDLRESYSWICAFAAMRIEEVTGSKTVEHFKPKAIYPDSAYEWSNFRLVCGELNGRKGDYEDVMDPFTMPPFAFDLNPFSGEVFVHARCPVRSRLKALSTIKRLKLNAPSFCKNRGRHINAILRGGWDEQHAVEQSPFVFLRLREQGLI
jgi:uncharacterized protein (TIGR02646 family)